MGCALASRFASSGRSLTTAAASLTTASSTTILRELNARLSGSEISRRSMYLVEFNCPIAPDCVVSKDASHILIIFAAGRGLDGGIERIVGNTSLSGVSVRDPPRQAETSVLPVNH